MMYRIRFSPYLVDYKTACPELQCCRVYSEHIEQIHMFLKQHNFDPNQTIIENVSPDEANEDDLDQHQLKKYFIQSNEDKQVHEVYTSPHFIEHTLHYVSDKVGDTLILGECILRRDIPLIELIIHYVDTLPCAEVLDFQALDDQSVDTLDWMTVKKSIEDLVDNPSSSIDTGRIWEMLDLGLQNDEVCPFTLEAYVECFVKIVNKRYYGSLEEGYTWMD
jgi:hypothetical protein